LLLRAAGGDERIREMLFLTPCCGGDYCLRHSRQEDEEGKVFLKPPR
jgi:hypothetical protein